MCSRPSSGERSQRAVSELRQIPYDVDCRDTIVHHIEGHQGDDIARYPGELAEGSANEFPTGPAHMARLLASLSDFIFSGQHLAIMKRRREWFHPVWPVPRCGRCWQAPGRPWLRPKIASDIFA